MKRPNKSLDPIHQPSAAYRQPNLHPTPTMQQHEQQSSPNRSTSPETPTESRRHPTICRRLFGDIEQSPEADPHQQQCVERGALDQQVDQLIEEGRLDNAMNIGAELVARDRRELMRKWNFDFETETPLPGEWEWEAMVEMVGVADGRGRASGGEGCGVPGGVEREYCDSKGENGA